MGVAQTTMRFNTRITRRKEIQKTALQVERRAERSKRGKNGDRKRVQIAKGLDFLQEKGVVKQITIRYVQNQLQKGGQHKSGVHCSSPNKTGRSQEC